MANVGAKERPQLLQSIGIPLMVASSVALFTSPIHHIVTTIVFLTVGPILLAFTWTRDPKIMEPSNRLIKISAKIWAGVFISTCLWELGSYVLSYWAHNDHAYPTISILVGPLLNTTAGKGIFLLIWIGVGLQLLRPWQKT